MQAKGLRRDLVAGHNSLCSQLLDVQVDLSQNQPASMTDQERSDAAHQFQAQMKVL